MFEDVLKTKYILRNFGVGFYLSYSKILIEKQQISAQCLTYDVPTGDENRRCSKFN